MARTTISLPDDISQMLNRVGNRSGYIARAVEARWRAWQQALGVLAARGWASNEVLAACDATSGFWHEGPMKASYMRMELEDGSRLEQLVEKWRLDVDHWEGLVDDMTDEVAHALWGVSQEFWIGNEELRAKVARLEG